jgi:hypothetical protein
MVVVFPGRTVELAQQWGKHMAMAPKLKTPPSAAENETTEKDKKAAADEVKAMTKGKGSIIAAAILTGLYVVVAIYLLVHFGLERIAGGNWERSILIFNALSALGFAAAGVLLGTTVQQVNVANAQRETVNAKVGEADAKRQEGKTADQAAVLVDAAAKSLSKRLGKTFGTGSQAFWQGQLSDPDDDRLRQAIMDMDEVLRQRS